MSHWFYCGQEIRQYYKAGDHEWHRVWFDCSKNISFPLKLRSP